PFDQRGHVGRLIARPPVVLQIGAAHARCLHLDNHVERTRSWIGHVEIGHDAIARKNHAPHVSPFVAAGSRPKRWLSVQAVLLAIFCRFLRHALRRDPAAAIGSCVIFSGTGVDPGSSPGWALSMTLYCAATSCWK